MKKFVKSVLGVTLLEVMLVLGLQPDYRDVRTLLSIRSSS